MKNRISEFVVGLIFGLGLIVSGMTDPGKVLGFLDLAGLWDPSLAFVMGGAIAVGVFAFAVANLEAQLKVTPRKTKPEPERVISGASRSLSATTDSHLARLEAEADKTGDRSKIVSYKRQLKQNHK